jgi:outer membrane biosynthesis protein TonB
MDETIPIPASEAPPAEPTPAPEAQPVAAAPAPPPNAEPAPVRPAEPAPEPHAAHVAGLAAGVARAKAALHAAEDHQVQVEADAGTMIAEQHAAIETARQATALAYAEFQAGQDDLAAAVATLGDLSQ